MQLHTTTYLGCIFVVLLPSSLSNPTASRTTSVEQRCEENPFAFPLRFPHEIIPKSSSDPGLVGGGTWPPKLALHWLEEADLLNSPNFTDPFRGNVTDYVEVRATHTKTLWSAYHTDEDDADPTASEHYDRIIIKNSYLEGIDNIETRIRSTLTRNLKAALWVDLVTLFNSNLDFRYFMLEDRKAMSLMAFPDSLSVVSSIWNVISFVRRVTLPAEVPPLEEKFVEQLYETYKLFREQAIKTVRNPADFENSNFTCSSDTFHNELHKEARNCLQTKLADTNKRWRTYEKIIDHIRSKFNASKRTCSKLYNPVERWM